MERNYALPGGIAVDRLQPAIGAVISGIDLSGIDPAAGLDAAKAQSIRTALYAHGAVFLRGQTEIGFTEHLALARAFGTPVCDGDDPERPEVTPVRAKAHSREGTASMWHSDDCYAAAPPAVSILRAIDPCPFGGDTCFSSAVAAYAGLPDTLKAQIAGLRYASSLAARMPKGYAQFGAPDKWTALMAKYPPVTQPVVLAHPVTGVPALYTNMTWSLAIEGMEAEAGQALIARLSNEFTRPEYQARWSWRAGDIAIWDNRLVQHYGVPDHQTDRYLERITVAGEVLETYQSAAAAPQMEPAA